MDIWVHRCRLFCHSQWIYLDEYIQVTKHCYANQWTGFYMIGTSVRKELRRSSHIILWESAFRCHKAELASFFYLGFLSPIFTVKRTAGDIISSTFTCFTDSDIYRAIAAGSSPLRIVGSRRKSRTTKLRALENSLFLHLHR